MPNDSVVEHVFRVKDLIGDAPGGSSTGNNTRNNEKNLASQLKKLAGIDLGLAALLKQSQIFTGYMGNLFAIIGAIIDTILAPLAPTAFKALAELGKKIPAISKMAEKYMPKLVEYGKSFITTVDTWLKRINSDWGKHFVTAIKWLVAINLGVRLLRLGGGVAMGITGARGVVGVARGAAGIGSRLMGRGGAAAASTAVTRAGAAAATTGTIAAGTKMSSSLAQVKAIQAAGGGPAAYTPYSTGAASTATSTSSAFGKAAKWGGRAMRGAPIIGAVTAGAMGYMEGRNRGESVGKAAARGGFNLAGAGAGAWAGGAIGTAVMPGIGTAIGMAIGGAIGGFGGNMLFDKLFGDKKQQGGFNIGSQTGVAGYRAPLFVGGVGEEFSQTTRELDMVFKDVTTTVSNFGDTTDGVVTNMADWSERLARIRAENEAYVPPSQTIPELDDKGQENVDPKDFEHWGVDPKTGLPKEYNTADAAAQSHVDRQAWLAENSVAAANPGGEDFAAMDTHFGSDTGGGVDASNPMMQAWQMDKAAQTSAAAVAAFHASGGGINTDFAPKFDANQQKKIAQQKVDQLNWAESLQEEAGETSQLAALAGMAEGSYGMGSDPTYQLVKVLKEIDEGGTGPTTVESWQVQPVSVTVINVPDSKSTVVPMSNMAQQTWDNDYWANRGEGGI